MNNRSKDMQKSKWFTFLLIFLVFNFYGCKKESPAIYIDKHENLQSNYLEIPIKKIKIKDDSKSTIYKLNYQGKDDVLLILENEKATLQINDKKILTDFNFTYDILLEDAINEIKMLSNKEGNIVLILPIATEEFLSYQLVKYNRKDKTFFGSFLIFDTHEDIKRKYLDSTIQLQENNSQYNIKIDAFTYKGKFDKIDNFAKSLSSKLTEEKKHLQNDNSLKSNNYKPQPIENLKGQYIITSKATSLYNKEEINLSFTINFENKRSAILSIGAEQVQDYWCEGPYIFTNENNILHGRGKCEKDGMDDFYIKKDNDQLYIKSKRFINQDWQKLDKK